MRSGSWLLPDPMSRLLGCFAIIFPKLQENEIPSSSIASVCDWDSLASINLYSLVEEEFGIEINLEEVAGLFSFELILEYIEGKIGASRD